MTRSLAALAFVAVAGFGWLANAQDVKVEEVVGGLSNPCGVAVQPGTGHVFLTDSARGRVCRVNGGKLEDVITGSPKDVYGKGPFYDIGPLGLVFSNDGKTLVVGDGGYKDGDECIRVYSVPEAGKAAVNYEKDASQKLGPLAAAEGVLGEGNLYALALTPSAVYITCNGDDTKGWIAKADLNGTKFGKLERWLPTKEAVDVDAPVGITVNKQGDLVVGQMGEVNKPQDSLLTFYSAKTGKRLLNFETKLYDITGLAYSPVTGRLYATDFAWMKPDEGGLFRLDQNGNDLKAVKVASLDKPTALAFAPDGTLYITVVGPKGESENSPTQGKLLKVSKDAKL
jgi:DNA-binding beta-propeller fold protein YncE